MITVERYTESKSAEWNTFLDQAKNSSFLFHRSYLQYHSDRFADYSLMLYEDSKLLALLPANLRDGTLVSHEGLTYGGFIFRPEMSLLLLLRIVRAALEYLHQTGISLLKYKAVPLYNDRVPSEEVNYALFLLEARLYRRDSSVTVDLRNRGAFSKGRKSEISKARRCGVSVAEEKDFGPFWSEVLVPNLKRRHGLTPVHTVEEISLLASRFPANIRQFCARIGGDIAAGITVYETETVAHAQYIGVNDLGRSSGALDFLLAHLITEVYPQKRYFDIGVCNEQDGRYLNAGLLAWKEGFRGRCFCHDFYEIDTAKFSVLDSVIEAREG